MERNWRPQAHGDSLSMDATSVYWRSQLQPEARQRIRDKIMETLNRHLPLSVPEGINELRKIAIRFEEKIYNASTSQSDYLRRISMKMLSMEEKAQPSAQINPTNDGVNQNPPDTGSLVLQSQVTSLAQARQFIPQNVLSDTSAAVQGDLLCDLVAVPCLNLPNKRPPVPAKRSITDCESYWAVQGDSRTKRERLSEPKEPTFSCPICMHAIVSLWSTICGHIFCEGCIKVAVQKQKKCPTCRRALTMKYGIHRVFLPTAD